MVSIEGIDVDIISNVIRKLEFARIMFEVTDNPGRYMSDEMKVWLVKMCEDELK